MYKNYCEIRDSLGMKDADVARATGITKSTFSDWKSGRSNPKPEKLQKIAAFFGVPTDYLMNGADVKNEVTAKRDMLDIKKDIGHILAKLSNKENGPVLYGGTPLTDESVELFMEEMEISLRRLELINKKTNNTKK